jgi:hypothetical protein
VLDEHDQVVPVGPVVRHARCPGVSAPHVELPRAVVLRHARGVDDEEPLSPEPQIALDLRQQGAATSTTLQLGHDRDHGQIPDAVTDALRLVVGHSDDLFVLLVDETGVVLTGPARNSSSRPRTTSASSSENISAATTSATMLSASSGSIGRITGTSSVSS